MNTNKGILWAAVAAVVLVGGWLFLSGPDEAEPGAKPAPLMEFSGSELHEMDNNEVVWKLNVGHAVLEGDRNTMNFTDVDGYFRDKDRELTLTADRGTAKRNEKLLYIEGNVVGRTSDGAVLYAENLTYDGMTGRLSTDAFFTVERDGRVLTADSFVADRILQTVEARGNARLADKEDGK